MGRNYQEYVTRLLDDSELSPIVLLNKDIDSLVFFLARKQQLAFLFLRIVFEGKLKHFLRGLLPVDKEKWCKLF